MSRSNPSRIGYVVKRYPRYSETFIVNEILAHEAAGWEMEIFSLRPPVDTHFQDLISRVCAPVKYLTVESMKASALWKSLTDGAAEFPGFWETLDAVRDEDVTDLFQGMLLARLICQRGIDHLHAHFATSAATVARLAARFAGIRFTLTAHAKDIYHDSVRPDDLERKIREAYATVTVSDFNLCHLKERWPSQEGQVHRVYNGMHLDALAYSPPNYDSRQILSVGRLIPKKGFGVLLDACALLRGRGVNFRCAIIGTGELESDLQSQIAGLGLENKVELLGARPQSEVFRMMRESAVMAAPCVIGEDGNRDGLPTVLLEAMALGTPCVSTDVTGIPEVIQHDLTGLLVPQNDPAELAAALERLLTDHALGQRLSENARQLIEAEFDVHRNTARLRDLFCEAIASPMQAAIPRNSSVTHPGVKPNSEMQVVR